MTACAFVSVCNTLDFACILHHTLPCDLRRIRADTVVVLDAVMHIGQLHNLFCAAVSQTHIFFIRYAVLTDAADLVEDLFHIVFNPRLFSDLSAVSRTFVALLDPLFLQILLLLVNLISVIAGFDLLRLKYLSEELLALLVFLTVCALSPRHLSRS